MSTAQTGGGNGAAPDGGSERKLPTRAGWWWRQGRYCPYIEEVDGIAGDLFIHMSGADVADDGTWLAPIPGPATCAALAEYGEAEDAILAAPRRPAPAPRRELFNATMVLMDAIRAERDGAA